MLHLANASQNEAERMKRNICSLLFQENMYINPKNIQLVSETNQALNHLMTLYLKEGDCVIAEEPSFPTMPASSATRASSWSPFPWRPTAWIWTSWRPPSRKYAPKFIYTMPNYHNPTGIVMSLEKRHRLLEITGKYCIPVIEEDSQRDFRYEGGRLPTLYSLDRYRSVVYLDSFTLTFPYGIKTGYIVGPTDLIDTLGRLIIVDETSVSSMGQYMLNEYIERGYFARHVQRLAARYARKLELLCRGLDRIADKGIHYTRPKGGLLLWCTLDEDINERTLFRRPRSGGC